MCSGLRTTGGLSCKPSLLEPAPGTSLQPWKVPEHTQMFSPPSIAVRKDAGGCAKMIFSGKSYPACESELPPSTEWLRSVGRSRE